MKGQFCWSIWKFNCTERRVC